MNRREFIGKFKTQMKVQLLLANESLKHIKQKQISNQNENHKLYTLLLQFSELKRKLMYFLYNLDVKNSDLTLDEIHEVMVEILSDSVIFAENDTFGKDNDYFKLCKMIQEYYVYAQSCVKNLTQLLLFFVTIY